MEYVQEWIATIHDFGDRSDVAVTSDITDALSDTAVIVPMTAREFGRQQTKQVLTELLTLDPGAVYVPVRAPVDQIDAFRDWLESIDPSMTVLWCNAPSIETLLESTAISTQRGKGSDVWLALGPATDNYDYVVVHDADAQSYDRHVVSRLLWPLTNERRFDFSKGYYTRIEDDQFYGRLFRLCYKPLVDALVAEPSPTPTILAYLRSFRYALAGEFAVTADFGRKLTPPPSWGLEIATLGDAYDVVGRRGSVQVDLGRHEHNHRPVTGMAGLERMSRSVVATLFDVLDCHDVDLTYDTLRDRFLTHGEQLIDQYRVDATINGFEYDATHEREQLERYATAIDPSTDVERLPPWAETPFPPSRVLEAAKPGTNYPRR